MDGEMENWEMKKETYREGWRNQQPDKRQTHTV